MNKNQNYLEEMLAADQANIQISKDLFREHDINDLLDKSLQLFDQVLKCFYDTIPPNNIPFWEVDGEARTDLALQITMLLSANTQFHIATTHLMRGQADESWGHLRRAIEATGIAFLASKEASLGDIYRSGDIKQFRDATSTKKILPSLDSLTAELNYDIEYANSHLHQNSISNINRLRASMQMVKNRFSLTFQYDVYDRGTETVRQIAIWIICVMVRSAKLFAASLHLNDQDLLSNLKTIEIEANRKKAEFEKESSPNPN